MVALYGTRAAAGCDVGHAVNREEKDQVLNNCNKGGDLVVCIYAPFPDDDHALYELAREPPTREESQVHHAVPNQVGRLPRQLPSVSAAFRDV